MEQNTSTSATLATLRSPLLCFSNIVGQDMIPYHISTSAPFILYLLAVHIPYSSGSVKYHNCSCGAPMYPPETPLFERSADSDSLEESMLNNISLSDLADERIVNGAPARREEFPWLVGIQTEKWFTAAPKCGGSLITDRHVVSAGHCLRGDSGLSPSNTYALIGAWDWTDRFDVRRSQIVRVMGGRVPDNFNETFQNDMSILELEQPIELNPTAYPICLPPIGLDLKTVKKGVVSGWGRLKDGGKQPHKNFKTVRHLKIMDHVACNQLPAIEEHRRKGSKLLPLTERQICALGDDTDSCQGDSGGPLMWLDEKTMRYHLIGLVSFGWGCNTPGSPGIYTNMLHPAIRNFVTCNVNGGVTCTS